MREWGHYERTIGSVLAVNKLQFDANGNVIQKPDYEAVYTKGDGTVPLLSSERLGRGLDLNGIAVKRIPFVSTRDRFKDSIVEHTALTANQDVWNTILNSLKSNSLQARADKVVRRGFAHHANSTAFRPPLPLQDPSDLESGEAYYIKFTGADRLTVTDAQGNTNTPIEGTMLDKQVPGVIISENATSADVNLGAELAFGQSYSFSFRSFGQPIEIELTKGKGNAPENVTQVVRYLDVNLPAGTVIMLKITAGGVENARYDVDGDGMFESTIAPSGSAIGSAASDVQAPVVTQSSGWR